MAFLIPLGIAEYPEQANHYYWLFELWPWECTNCKAMIYIAHTEGYINQKFFIMFTDIFSVKFESKIQLI
jgi:hypothetical protein